MNTQSSVDSNNTFKQCLSQLNTYPLSAAIFIVLVTCTLFRGPQCCRGYIPGP